MATMTGKLIRFTDDQIAWLKRMEKQSGCNQTEIVRMCIDASMVEMPGMLKWKINLKKTKGGKCK